MQSFVAMALYKGESTSVALWQYQGPRRGKAWGGGGGGPLRPHPNFQGNLVHTVRVSPPTYLFQRRQDAYKNMTFAKFLMHSQTFEGLKVKKFPVNYQPIMQRKRGGKTSGCRMKTANRHGQQKGSDYKLSNIEEHGTQKPNQQTAAQWRLPI